MQTDLVATLLTVAGTIMAATITVVAGRYYERKREIESHFRARKIEMYDQFLKEFFAIFNESSKVSGAKKSTRLVEFLREWQRSVMLWGSPNVLKAFIAWMSDIKAGEITGRSFLLMEGFFKAMRTDVGMSNFGLPEGVFISLMMKDPAGIIAAIKRDPNSSLADLAAAENVKL